MTQITVDDAHQLFLGCIVEYEGRLVWVRDIRSTAEGTMLEVRDILTQRNLSIPADPDMITCPTGDYRLGYVQDRENAVYLSRAARRQYRVGWSDGNVNGLNPMRMTRNGASFVNNLKGIFMSYKEALDNCKQHGGVWAFDRMFAIASNGEHLCYKGQAIAIIDRETGFANLANHNHQHLEQLYQQAIKGA